MASDTRRFMCNEMTGADNLAVVETEHASESARTHSHGLQQPRR